MFYDIEATDSFSDIETDSMGLSDNESSYSYEDVHSPSLINDTLFYSHNNNNNYYNYNYNNNKNQDIKHYDCEDFPMTVFAMEEVLETPSQMIKVENMKIEKTENSSTNKKLLEAGEVTQTLFVPVIVAAEEEKYLSYKSDSEESRSSDCSVSLTEDDDSPAEDPKCWPSRVRRAVRRRYTTEESDDDWEPEEEQSVRRSRRKEEREAHKAPVPQRRKTGGTKKITQWILSLLRDPEYNPSVISWENEQEGVFYITDTAKYAKLWGERKKNPSMNYEKLSRAMRYYYKNGELKAVEKRTTYQFGRMSDYWRTSKE